MWYSHYSPQFLAPVPPGMTREQMLRDFDRRVITQEPLAYARLVADDLTHWAQPGRTPSGPTDFRLTDFRFKPFFPTRVVAPYLPGMLRDLYTARPTVRVGEAKALVGYQHWYYTPGTLLAICAFLALLAVFGVGRAKRSGLRSAAWLFGGQAIVVVVTTSMASGFGWRYQLPEFVLLPAAGAIAVTAMVRRPVAVTADEKHAPLAVERLAHWVLSAQRALPSRARIATDHEKALKLVRYALGSVICSVVSGATFAILFGFALVGSRSASLAASATGAIAGYWLNRAWTWERRHRADWRRELLPYWATIIGSAIAAALATGGVNALVLDTHIGRGLRTVIDLVAYFATYAGSFIVKYVVFDRLFASDRVVHSADPAQAET
jgi:putative flippase GtrA